MRVSGLTIIEMEGVSNAIVMETGMKVTSKITSLTAKASILGSMGRSTRVNGKTGSKRVKAFGRVFSGTLISVSGLSQKRMGTVFTSGRMGIDSKASGNSVSSTAKAQTSSQTVTSTRASTQTVSRAGSANTNGKIRLFTWVSSKMA